jgi:hypothetical protein
MNAITVLDDIAKAPGEVLKWLASPKGQAIEGIVETGLEVAIPQITGIVNIFNKYTTEAVKVQALAVASGAAAGSASTQKAAAVVNEVGPEVLAFAQANGLAAPTAAELLELNDLAVKFIQVFKPAAPVAPITNVTAVKS